MVRGANGQVYRIPIATLMRLMASQQEDEEGEEEESTPPSQTAQQA